MAPIKFEENIREKLQERELEPNKDSWDKLSSKLGHVEATRTNRRLWMAVAAGFMGLLLVVSYVLTSVDESQPVQLVDENSTIPSEVESVEKNTPLEENAPTLTTDIASEDTSNEPKKETEGVNNTVILKVEKAVAKVNETPVREKAILKVPVPVIIQKETIATSNNTMEEKPIETMGKEDLFVNTKINDVVAAVREMEASNNTITIEEIDELLLKAQRDIATNRILASSNKKIDPSSLLQDVEREMERSFRDKVFEALGEGYNKVRTAVVERNN